MARKPATSKYCIPSLAGIYDTLDEYAAPILRITMGAILIPHGMQKLFGSFSGPGMARMAQILDQIGYAPGTLWAWLIALLEFVGGIFLVLGFLTRPVAAALVIFMIVSVQFTSGKGFFWTAGGAEYSLLILVVALYFAIRGGGAYSIDRKIGREF
jgi:putative oxidoreductase